MEPKYSYDSVNERGSIYEFNTNSKLLKCFHMVSMIACILTFIGGFIITFNVSNVYHSYTYFSGGYYERNIGILLVGLLSTIIVTFIEFIACKVVCEFFNDVHIIREELQKKG